nr:hypothetical protein [Sedimentibacter sp.]
MANLSPTKVSTEIKRYIDNFKVGTTKIQIPYVLGGKKSSSELKEMYEDLGLTGTKLQNKINALADNEDTSYGIDCSGFALRVTNEASYNNELINHLWTGPSSYTVAQKYTNGISAAGLCSTNKCYKISYVKDMWAGDYIFFCKQKINGTQYVNHVAVIETISGNAANGYTITVVHSDWGNGPSRYKISISSGTYSTIQDNGTWPTAQNIYKKLFIGSSSAVAGYVCRPSIYR